MKQFEAIVPAPLADAAKAYQFSPATRVGEFIHVSGQLGFAADGTIPADFAEQVENAFGFIALILADVNAALADVFSLTSYHVGDLAGQLPIMADIKTRLLGEPHSAWTGVGTTVLAVPGALVEISAIARVKAG